MTLQLARRAGNRVGQRRRHRRVQHRFATLEPRAIERLKARRAKRADRLVEALVGAPGWLPTRVKEPAQVLDQTRAERGRELLVKGRLIERDRVRLVPRQQETHGPRRQGSEQLRVTLQESSKVNRDVLR